MVQEGSTLFMVPAVDMLNHATDPRRRNASLQQRNAPAAVGAAPVPHGGLTHFYMVAGALRTECMARMLVELARRRCT